MVSNFKDITSFEVVISYNDVLVEATGVNNIHSELVSGLEPVNYPSAGVVRINWNGSDPVTLPDNTGLFDLVVQGKAPGLSTINWLVADNQTRFINHFGVEVPVKDSMGNVTIAPNPEIWGFYEEKVCEFSKLSQMAIPSGGTGTLAVIWDTPKGTFTGALYEVPSAGEEDSGLYSVKVIDQMNCIDNDTVQVTVVSNPQANLPSEGDTLFYSPPFQLMASPGYFMYVWNTGENANFINVTEDGEYTLIIKTEEGCADTSSVVMINGSVIIQVPNAFTPNNDGLNDTFRPVVDYERVRQFSMVIYNRWGQMIFETNNPAEGWDGKDAPEGVYSWVVSYSNQTGKGYQLKGVVTLIK
jgi:gliding motility-associated-like protein